jgi:ketosteroid isomerase-like protein
VDGYDIEEIARRFLLLWEAGDIDSCVGFLAEDAVYALYISRELLPFGGETVGRSNIEIVFRQIRSQWDYLVFRPISFRTEGDTVRVRIEHMYRHVASGEVLTGFFRLIFTFRDGLLVRGDEYHDRAMVEAFMRLHGQR